jgi:hypothetical protein
MRCFWTALATALLLACCAALPAEAAATDPAEIAPADSLFYVRIDAGATQEALAHVAMPPVSGLIGRGMPATPFGYVANMLDLPAGTVDAAAPHLAGAALAFDGDYPFVLLAFDEPQVAAGLLAGSQADELGVVARALGTASAVVRDGVLILGSNGTCTRVALGDYPPLAADAAFQEARAATADAPAWAYVAAPVLVARLREEMWGQEARILEAFVKATGLTEARYATLKVTGLSEPEALQVVLSFADSEVRLLQLASSEPMSVAAAVPDPTAAVALAHWGDGAAFFGSIRDMLLEMDDEIEGRGGLAAEIAQMEGGFGFTLDELFASIGPGVAAWLYDAAPGRLIRPEDWAVVLPLEDATTFRRCLDLLVVAGMGGPSTPATVAGVEVNRLGPAPAYYAVAEDRLVVAGGPQTIGRYLDWLAAGEGPTMAAHVPPQGSLYARLDSGMLLNSYPAPESGAKAVLRLSREGDALVLRAGAEDFDPAQAQELVARGYPAVMLAMLMPALGRARGQARMTAGRANLHNIGLGLMMYANDNDGAYPETLAELLELGYLATPDVLVAPADESPPLIPGTDVRCSYQYVGPAMRVAPPQAIVCFTRPGVYPDGRNVLCADMTVMWATEGMLAADQGQRTSLRASYEAFVFETGGELTVKEQITLREFYGIEE